MAYKIGDYVALTPPGAHMTLVVAQVAGIRTTKAVMGAATDRALVNPDQASTYTEYLLIANMAYTDWVPDTAVTNDLEAINFLKRVKK